MKILIIALSGIGDALMFTPALTKLKEDLPYTEIEALVMFKGVEQLYKNLPQIKRVHFIDFLKNNPIKSLYQLLKLCRRYDASINVYPSNRKEYNIISFLVAAPKRYAVKYLKMDRAELGFLNNYRVEEEITNHNVITNLKMIEMITSVKITEEHKLNFPISEESLLAAHNFLSENIINEEDLVVGFHPGCNTLKNHINRRWAPENFAGLGRKLIEEKNAKVLLFGGPEENELKNKIAELINSERALVINADSLVNSAAIMKRCNLFVSNDSGNMHIASALNIPVVAIIGPTNINFIRPWKTPHKIATLNLICAPCFFYSPKPLSCSRVLEPYKCVRDLNTEFVMKLVNNLLEETHSS